MKAKYKFSHIARHQLENTNYNDANRKYIKINVHAMMSKRKTSISNDFKISHFKIIKTQSKLAYDVAGAKNRSSTCNPCDKRINLQLPREPYWT